MDLKLGFQRSTYNYTRVQWNHIEISGGSYVLIEPVTKPLGRAIGFDIDSVIIEIDTRTDVAVVN